MGAAANALTRRMRHEAHLVFDKVWKAGLMSRTDAYQKLATVMGLSFEMTHIGFFNAEQCQKVMDEFQGITRGAVARDCRQREKHSRRRGQEFRRQKMDLRRHDIDEGEVR